MAPPPVVALPSLQLYKSVMTARERTAALDRDKKECSEEVLFIFTGI